MMKRQLFHCMLAAMLGLVLAALLFWQRAAHPAQAGSDVHCVNQTGMGCDAVCGGGCYNSVQFAVNAASLGHEIRVADGTYSVPGGGTVAVITKELIVVGGYDQPCGDSDFDPDLYHTTLDAQWGGSVISITNAGNVMLDFLTLTHGDGSGNCPAWPGSCGGGIYAKDTDLHVIQCVVTNNVGGSTGGANGGGIYAYADGHVVEIGASHIVSNTAALSSSLASEYGYGGGVYIGNGTALLWENEILDNVGSVNHGGSGGIHLNGVTRADVLTNTIRGNKANINPKWYGGGGGLIVDGYSVAVYVAANRIDGNWAGYQRGLGGGVYVWQSDVHLARNTIVNNTTGMGGWKGGGVHILSSTPVTLSNNLIAHNSAIYGGGVYVTRGGTPASQVILVNNTIADNDDSGIVADRYATLTMTNNLISGHVVGITNTASVSITISADTNLFWNTSDPIIGSNAVLEDPLLAGNYHLRSGSPALDAGLIIPLLTVDLEGDPRPQDDDGDGTPEYDLGAFEGVQEDVYLYLPLVLR